MMSSNQNHREMSGNLTAMPPGFWFNPTDEELIDSYLLNKVTGVALPWNGILERNIYGQNMAPWDVFGDICKNNNQDSSSYWQSTVTWGENDQIKNIKKTIYVFTKLTRSGKLNRVTRKAGCGTWEGQTGPKKIRRFHDGQIIGSSRMLTFQMSKRATGSSDHQNHNWVMYEFCLDGVNSTTVTDLVLCKINITTSYTNLQFPRENLHGNEMISSSTLSCNSGTSHHENYPVCENEMSKSLSQKRPAAEALQQVEEEDLDNNNKNKKQRMMNYDEDFDFDNICFDNEDLYLQGLDLFEILSSCDLDSESTQQQQTLTEVASQPPGYIDHQIVYPYFDSVYEGQQEESTLQQPLTEIASQPPGYIDQIVYPYLSKQEGLQHLL